MILQVAHNICFLSPIHTPQYRQHTRQTNISWKNTAISTRLIIKPYTKEFISIDVLLRLRYKTHLEIFVYPFLGGLISYEIIWKYMTFSSRLPLNFYCISLLCLDKNELVWLWYSAYLPVFRIPVVLGHPSFLSASIE